MNHGFTLVELLLVLALLAAITVATVPLGVTFYQRMVLDETTERVRAALRDAQQSALTRTAATAHGVAWVNEQFVQFTGANYAVRDSELDQRVLLPGTVAVTGPTEVVFAERTGIPEAAAVITLSVGFATRTIAVSTHGVIE